jgi:hypothetical protein
MNGFDREHKGPNLGVLAIVFTVLFNLGLFFVISVRLGAPHFPNPSDSAEIIATYFRDQPHAVLLCAFFQFGSAIPLGLFTATLVSRLRFLGVRAAGAHIALFGGFMTAFNLAVSSLALWVMAYPGIAGDGAIIRAMYYFVFAVGGVGYQCEWDSRWVHGNVKVKNVDEHRAEKNQPQRDIPVCQQERPTDDLRQENHDVEM